MLANDLRFAVRMPLLPSGSPCGVALGLGIGLNATVFTFVNAVLTVAPPSTTPKKSCT